MEQFRISPGKPYPLGASVISEDSVNIAFVCDSKKAIGIKIYKGRGNSTQCFYLAEENRIGNIYCAVISGQGILDCEYNFFEDDTEFTDPYGKLIIGNERWGKVAKNLKCAFVTTKVNLDYIVNRPLKREYSDSIFYLLHVRGFTRHSSSGVKNPGTFEGIVEKIPYLKELGITAIELMPAYEFLELESISELEGEQVQTFDAQEPKLNYWGYKAGYYFAPKASYAAKGRTATESFRELVEELHNAGIELIMQFYFTDKHKPAFILETLKYWVLEYNVDGFHLMGERIPLTLLGTEPMLKDTKLMYYDFPSWEIYGQSKPEYKNLALYNDDFMYSLRRFLKSDEGQIGSVIGHMRHIDDYLSQVHYITNSNGFTLMDLVSYDRKHNSMNGEFDRDGNPYNASWNCGVEGPTSKKSVKKLRRRQIKNAIVFNILSQSAPLILAGDEFGNSQKGNNNPYCIDGPVTWLNWSDLEKNKEIYLFYRRLIEIRNSNPILHMNRPFRMTDYLANGFPDLSLHGDEAWKLETDDLTRHFAMLYSSDYAYSDSEGKATSSERKGELIFIGINMHWSMHEFALPKLPDSKKWYKIVDTYIDSEFKTELIGNDKKIFIKDRSIIVLIAK